MSSGDQFPQTIEEDHQYGLHEPGQWTHCALCIDHMRDEKITELLAENERLKRELDEAWETGRKAGIEAMRGPMHDQRRMGQKETASDLLKAQAECAALLDGMEMAWGVIANAGRGDWALEHPEWQEVAARWRDEHWHPAPDRARGKGESPMLAVLKLAHGALGTARGTHGDPCPKLDGCSAMKEFNAALAALALWVGGP